MSVEEYARDMERRGVSAMSLSDAGQRLAALDFNARLVTALRAQQIWPMHTRGRKEHAA